MKNTCNRPVKPYLSTITNPMTKMILMIIAMPDASTKSCAVAEKPRDATNKM